MQGQLTTFLCFYNQLCVFVFQILYQLSMKSWKRNVTSSSHYLLSVTLKPYTIERFRRPIYGTVLP